MAKAPLEELERQLISYESFKKVLQQYLQRLLASDQDTLALVAEMLEAVKSLSTNRALVEPPADIHRVLALQEAALYNYGGIAHVEGAPAPPLLEGGVVKVDDPQVYGMSLICTWLDCIVSNPEQGLDSLRRVFLTTTDSWGSELNRIFRFDLGRMRPIVDPSAWLNNLLGNEQPTTLNVARVNNVAQFLGLEPLQAAASVPIAIWRHLLHTRPVYDFTPRDAIGRSRLGRAGLMALQREAEGRPAPCLYRIGIDPPPSLPPLPPPSSLGNLQTALGCTLASPVRLEMLERTEHLNGTAPPTFTATLPLGNLPRSLSLILNHPPELVMQDVTPATAPASQRILRLSSSSEPERKVRLFRVQTPPQEEWPSQHGWTRVYRFHDLADIGVATCPPGSYLEISLRETSEPVGEESEVYFHRWGERRISLRISAKGLRRAAQTGALVLLQCDEESALDVLAALQGLIGPASKEIEPVVSHLDCQVRWRPQTGPELFRED